MGNRWGRAQSKCPFPSRPLKNVGEAASARQKQAKKRNLRVVNEHLIRSAHPSGAVLKHVQPVAVSLFLTLRWQRR